MCPFCRNPSAKVRKKGFFKKAATRTERVQRFFCRACRRSFSAQTGRLTFRAKKPHLDQTIFRLLASGVSQRRCAIIMSVNRGTVAKKLTRLAQFGRAGHRRWLRSDGLPRGTVAVFDEMETFEHSKMKPLSIAVVVQEGTRLVIAAEVSQMPAKGLLAERSRRKYGRRRDDRPLALRSALAEARVALSHLVTIKSDQSPRYPKYVAEVLPGILHETFKGRRGCVVGQGELKAGGFDPLFALNHSCASFRDDLKRLTRRTWCTTKRADRLQALLDLSICFHNARILEPKKVPRIEGDPV